MSNETKEYKTKTLEEQKQEIMERLRRGDKDQWVLNEAKVLGIQLLVE